MFEIIINNKKILAKKDKTILECALENNIYIPTLCYHKNLSPYGACRLCLVEISLPKMNKKTIVSSCTYLCEKDLIVNTDSEKVKKLRQIMLGFILARTNNSIIINDLAEKYKIKESSSDVTLSYLLRNSKNSSKNNCILCGLCERVCSEIIGKNAISSEKRGNKKTFNPPFNKGSEKCIGCGLCAYLCPSNAITISEM